MEVLAARFVDERLERDLVDRPTSVITRLELVGHLAKLEKRIEELERVHEPEAETDWAV